MGIDVVTLAVANAATDEKIKQAAIGGGVDLTDYLKKEEAYTRQEIDDKVENLDYENLKNKPFYSEIVTGINRDIVPLQKIELMGGDDAPEGVVGAALPLSNTSPIIPNVLYNFTFDDEIIQVKFMYFEGIFLAGNLGMVGMGEDTGESYLIGLIGLTYDGDLDNPMLSLYSAATEGEHTIGLSYIGDTIPLIPENTYNFELQYDSKDDWYYYDVYWNEIFGLRPQDGDKYKLTFGDTVREITPVYDDNYEAYLAGNLHLDDKDAEDTGENYFLLMYEDYIKITPLNEGEYTVSLEKVLQSTEIEIIHKIDSKYLDIDMNVPYTKDLEGNVIFENDVLVDGGDVSVREIRENVRVLKTNINTINEDINQDINTINGDINTINENINIINDDIDAINEILVDLDDSIDQSSCKQLVQGLSGGFSANPNIIPTGRNTWVEGEAVPFTTFYSNGKGELFNSQPYLSVSIVTDGNNTMTEAYINCPNGTATNKQAFINELQKHPILYIIFEDTLNQVYYVEINNAGLSSSGNTLKLRFKFISGQDTFPIDTKITRKIQTLMGIPLLGTASHSEGGSTIAKGEYSHAEGKSTVASGECSHAEGDSTVASGMYSHAEGDRTKASGRYSHAEGVLTEAKGNWSHAEGDNTIASGRCSHVQGEYNIEDVEGKYAHIVGNGEKNGNLVTRSNAHTLDWDGNAWYAGTVEATGISMNFMKPGDQLAKGTGDFKENRILGQNILVLGQLYEINIDNLDCFIVTCYKNSDNSGLIIENPNYNFYGSQDDSSGAFSVRLEGDSNEHTITIRGFVLFKDDLSPYLYSLERKILELETKLNAIIQ